MKNLAGNLNCDKYIQIELSKAGIDIKQIENVESEVPYSIIGKLGNWSFKRARYYWVAYTEGKGIPLNKALEMYNKKYPDEMFDHEQEFGIYGNSIRSGGHCGCPSPDKYGQDNGYVKSYHIDSQEGLNEFVRVLNDIEYITSKIMKNLNLKKVLAYELTAILAYETATVDDKRSESLGYYKDWNVANVDAKNWYGSNGNVKNVTLYEDEDGNIYNVKCEGKYKDIDRLYREDREDRINQIKSKLTPEECKLLGL